MKQIIFFFANKHLFYTKLVSPPDRYQTYNIILWLQANVIMWNYVSNNKERMRWFRISFNFVLLLLKLCLNNLTVFVSLKYCNWSAIIVSAKSFNFSWDFTKISLKVILNRRWEGGNLGTGQMNNSNFNIIKLPSHFKK